MTWQWVVTTVFAGIGALLGLLNEYRRHRDRPRADVRARVLRQTNAILDRRIKGEWLCEVKNLGDETAHSVFLNSETGEIHADGRPAIVADELAPGETAEFGFDCDDMDGAWVTISWTTPTKRRKRLVHTWSPLRRRTELGVILEAQMHFVWWRKLMIRALAGPTSGPYTLPAFSTRLDPGVFNRIQRAISRVEKNGIRIRVAYRLARWRPAYLVDRDPASL